MANLSKQKRERMLQFLNTIKEEHKDNSNVLVALSEIETELQNKKYGLVWEKHEEQVDIMMKENIPVFTEVKEKEIEVDKNKPYNFLLEGDNLHSLKLIEKTHKGKIDVIYIDPPYNTGNKDFIYDDKFIDKTDGYSHSKWLSFMSERLEIAKKLLSSNGLIFISIDDNEQAQLKLLCDSIFGEENSLSPFIWHKKTQPSFLTKKIINVTEYILVYSNNSNFDIHIKGGYTDPNKAIEMLNLSNNISDRVFKKENVFIGKEYSGILKKGTYGNGELKVKLKNDIKVLKGIPDKDIEISGRFKWSQQKIDKAMSENAKVFFKSIKTLRATMQLSNNKKKVKSPINLLSKYINETPTNTDATNELKNMFNGVSPMSYPKPTKLIKFFVESLTYNNKNSTILDFFAGSGTTGHAVAQLNKEDGGNRRYILCTNNENNICEDVTYKRLTNIQEELPHNLKYYKTDFLARNSEYLSDEMLKHIIEMVQLEHAVTIDNNEYMLVLDDEESDALEKNISNYPNLKAIYVSKEVLLTKEQEEKFSHLDIHIIPDYYFSFELKEEGLSW